jgi:hypothetical protein
MNERTVDKKHQRHGHGAFPAANIKLSQDGFLSKESTPTKWVMNMRKVVLVPLDCRMKRLSQPS